MLYSTDGKTWFKGTAIAPYNKAPAKIVLSKKQALLSVACALALLVNVSMVRENQNGTQPYNLAVAVPSDVTLDNEALFEFHEPEHNVSKPVAHSVASNPSLFKEWMWYLKAREGFVPTVYRCPAGIRTIGYGHNVEAWGHTEETEDGICTYKEASTVLYRDIQNQYNQVTKLLPHLTKNQALAVTSLAANCGINKIMYPGGNAKKGYSTFWKAVQAGKTPNFGVYTRYKTPKGKVVQSPNLIAARSFEQAMFNNGNWVKVWNGKKLVTMSFNDAAEFYRQVLLNRDIVPAQKAGIYDEN